MTIIQELRQALSRKPTVPPEIEPVDVGMILVHHGLPLRVVPALAHFLLSGDVSQLDEYERDWLTSPELIRATCEFRRSQHDAFMNGLRRAVWEKYATDEELAGEGYSRV